MDRKTFKTSETVDFVIVGSGASGGIIARELSRAGHSVVVMEQGPRMSPGDFEHDELKYSMLSGITNNPATKAPIIPARLILFITTPLFIAMEKIHFTMVCFTVWCKQNRFT